MARAQDASQFGYAFGRGGTSLWGSGGYSDSRIGVSTRDGVAPGAGGGGASSRPYSTRGATNEGKGGTGGNGAVVFICFRGPPETPAQTEE